LFEEFVAMFVFLKGIRCFNINPVNLKVGVLFLFWDEVFIGELSFSASFHGENKNGVCKAISYP